MSWLRTLGGIGALVTLAMVAHPPAALAFFIEVRSGPGMTYEIVAKVPPGGSYVAVAQKQDWYKIQLPDGRAGWIHLHDTVQEKPRSQTATPPALLSHTAPPAASAMPSKLSHPQLRRPPGRDGPRPAYGTSHGLVIGNAAYAESPLRMRSRTLWISQRCCAA